MLLPDQHDEPLGVGNVRKSYPRNADSDSKDDVSEDEVGQGRREVDGSTATFACEAAHQTARLSGDDETCDLVEARLGAYAATLFDTRRALPDVVARELRRAGVTCACRCSMCSIGLCGCIRATTAATEVGWGGEEPAVTEGLVLLGPPRPGSQLAEAGLDEGDRVLAVDSDPVGRNADAQAVLRRHEVGDEVRLDVERRDGERIEVTVRRVG